MNIFISLTLEFEGTKALLFRDTFASTIKQTKKNSKMNTFLSRLNTIFAFTLSVMAALTFCCFLTTAFNSHKSKIDIGTSKVTV